MLEPSSVNPDATPAPAPANPDELPGYPGTISITVKDKESFERAIELLKELRNSAAQDECQKLGEIAFERAIKDLRVEDQNGNQTTVTEVIKRRFRGCLREMYGPIQFPTGVLTDFACVFALGWMSVVDAFCSDEDHELMKLALINDGILAGDGTFVATEDWQPSFDAPEADQESDSKPDPTPSPDPL